MIALTLTRLHGGPWQASAVVVKGEVRTAEGSSPGEALRRLREDHPGVLFELEGEKRREDWHRIDLP